MRTFFAGVILSSAILLLLSCSDHSPKLAESQSQYCAILDRRESNITKNARAYDSRNALQGEEMEKAKQQIYQHFNGALHEFFAAHNKLDKWAVKIEPGVSIINNEMVKVEFKSACADTLLITVVSRKDAAVISFLNNAKTGSYALVSGAIQQIGYFSAWGPGAGPVYIAFLVSSVVAANESGATGIEAKSTYPADFGIKRGLDVAAADASARDERRKDEYDRKHLQELLKKFRD